MAVSGGPDSIALLHSLIDGNRRESLSLRFHVAHLNHQLRAAESDADATFVADEAARLGVDVTIESRDVGAIAKQLSREPSPLPLTLEGRGVPEMGSRSAHLSIEAAGRQERYAFFHRVCLRVGAKVVALGHHSDDNAETILHRIVRGTGLRGLAGIPETRPLFPESDIRVVRPLLRADRRSILSYLESKGIRYRMDASNSDLGPTRNRLRHEILPALESVNPRARDALLRLAEQAGWAAEHIEDVADRCFDSFVVERRRDALVLDADALRRRTRMVQAEIVRQAILRFQLGERDVSFEHIRECVELLGADAGTKQLSLPHALCVEKRYHQLAFTLAAPPSEHSGNVEFVIAFGESTRIPEWGMEIACQVTDASGEELATIQRSRPGEIGRPDRDEWIDADAVHPPLIARHRRPGDRFTPLGAPGAKSIADFLVDAKVDRGDRDRLIVLADRLGPVWLVGYRIDDRVKLTANTRRVLRLSAMFLERP